MKYIIDKKFESKVERSDRVLECAESFGLGLESKEFVVYDNLEVNIEQGDIVYITGQSGSGKSIALRELARQIGESQPVADIASVALEETSLINQVGKSTDDAIRILSAAGLNDAYLFLRKPSELSDGQLYRFKIAKLIESDCRVWVADEFGAVLDRVTARVVAFNLQKQARAVGATVIVATTHKDLFDELGPDLSICKGYAENLEIRYVSE